MKRLDHAGTRRHLFGFLAAWGASIPLLGASRRPADAFGGDPGWDSSPGGNWGGHPGHNPGGYSCCCLLKGTKVSTPAGERAVENLQIGDEVVTLSGPKTIKWIGYNKYTKEDGRPWQASVMPIRIARFAIDDWAPHADLYLSPWHCVYVNDVLISVKHLVNGVSIAPAAPSDMAAIEYYHIEFGTHEVLFAEGAPVESFREELSEREYFLNFAQYERLYGRERQNRMAPFAPVFRYRNRREEMKGRARSVVSKLVDVRDPIQVARDQLARRAEALAI